jgi:hypothetical protein
MGRRSGTFPTWARRGGQVHVQRAFGIGVAIALLLDLVGIGATASGCSSCGEIDWARFRAPNAEEVGKYGVSARQELADEFVDCGALEDRSRQWVEKRLGKGSEWTGSERGRVSYTLGLCTEERDCLFTGDTESLEIYYDPDGNVESVAITNT